ncbi:hypothetical protein M434DRAFT_393093 [Hypoxylon sp. CO27-5]|nr:hypothetical protein M434DRAFT_393093 [Hypoxylon sp. CO27-5]
MRGRIPSTGLVGLAAFSLALGVDQQNLATICWFVVSVSVRSVSPGSNSCKCCCITDGLVLKLWTLEDMRDSKTQRLSRRKRRIASVLAHLLFDSRKKEKGG